MLHMYAAIPAVIKPDIVLRPVCLHRSALALPYLLKSVQTGLTANFILVGTFTLHKHDV